MSTIDFVLIDNKGKHHEIIVIERGTVVKFIFPFDVVRDKKGAKCMVHDFTVEGAVNNLPGLIVDRMHRLSEHNAMFDSIVIGERTHKLDVNYKEAKKYREAVFLDGVEIKAGYKVRFLIEDEESNTVSEVSHDFDEIIAMAKGDIPRSNLLKYSKFRFGLLPKENDENGFPAITKKTKFNEILYKNSFFKDDCQDFVLVLNNGFDKLMEVAVAAKKDGLSEISCCIMGEQFLKTMPMYLINKSHSDMRSGKASRTIKIDTLLKTK